MEETVDQITQLKACVNNLTSLLALPAIWTRHDPSRVTTTLLDVLVEMLELDFAYVRVSNVAGGSPMEEIRLAHGDREASVQEIGHALAPYLTLGSRQVSPRIPNPIAEGTASIAVFGLGIEDRAGVFVAGSRRSEFPTEIERLLLQVATNQAAIALQQNWVEERFRTMADSIPEVIWITALGPERVLYRSPSFEQVWGLSVAGLYQNPRLWTETIHPEDRDRVNNTFSLWIAGAEVGYHDIEYRIVRPDGDIRWIHERGALTRNEDAKPVGVCGISTDITEFQRGRATLERNQFYLNEGQRLTHMGSWAFNPAGFFDYWSEELFRIYGLDPKMGAPTLEEYLGTIHPQDRESMAETIRRMHVENCGCDVKKRIVRPDGEIRFIRCVGVPVLENGVLKGFIGTAMDVTEQEQMTQELRRREAYLAEAQRLSQTGSFGWKPASGDIVWSEETHRIFDVELTTKPTIELVLSRAHPEDRASIRFLIDRATREAKDWNLEHRVLMPDGTLKHLRVVAHAVHDELNDETEYVGAVMDVTAAKESLQALEKAYTEIRRLKDELEKENIVLREEIDRSSMFEEIVGESPAVQALLLRVAKVAPTDSTVLISGETGTGKELIARAIHKGSRRAQHAFVSVNCAAVPLSLIASELFGHEKGAFTGAIQRRLGRFELAEGGTIFLDEIGELPTETQISLLRVLQEREFERVGGSKIIRADVRVIAATNRDLRAAINAGTFRSDLYYRLNVFPIEVPPLRKRNQDIPFLVAYFIDRYSSKSGKKIGSIDSATLERLMAYGWPGNVRELQNVIERSIIVCETEKFTVDESWLAPITDATDQSNRPFFKLSPSEEKKAIEAALADARGRVSGPLGAAAKLGLSPSTLDSKIKALKINKYRYKAVS